ncbi:NAD-dependent epimerase/dehydratase family protein [Acrocarpospora corrugata]|nr:NAD(P)-dependent oxidoreductase [Acrocarpospora corrugata]
MTGLKSPRTICVTGAAGVVGVATVHELLEHGYRVNATDVSAHPAALPAQWSRADFQYTRADLTDYGDAVDVLTGADAVVHIANIPAPTLLPPARTLSANTTMNGNVFLAAAALGMSRVVYASSETTLGLNFEVPPRYAPLDEDHYPYPTTTYSLSKVLTETMADHISAWSGIPFVGLRFSNVIKPEDYQRFPSYWKDPAPRSFNLWSYIDVRDCALSARLSLEADVTGSSAYIIAAADTVMITPSAQLMAENFPTAEITKELGEFETLMTSERARAALGFEPRHSWRSHVQISQS